MESKNMTVKGSLLASHFELRYKGNPLAVFQFGEDSLHILCEDSAQEALAVSFAFAITFLRAL